MRAAEVALYRDMIVGILKDAGKALTTTEILAAKPLPGGANSLRTQLNWLAGDGQVIKVPGPKNSFRYSYRRPVEPGIAVTPREITPAGLAQLLRSLSEKVWVPKTAKSASALPFAIARLYHFAHDVASAAVHKQQDYDNVKLDLMQFKNDLVSTLATVDGILAKKELWSAKDSAKWLLSANGNSAEFDRLASEVERMQR